VDWWVWTILFVCLGLIPRALLMVADASFWHWHSTPKAIEATIAPTPIWWCEGCNEIRNKMQWYQDLYRCDVCVKDMKKAAGEEEPVEVTVSEKGWTRTKTADGTVTWTPPLPRLDAEEHPELAEFLRHRMKYKPAGRTRPPPMTGRTLTVDEVAPGQYLIAQGNGASITVLGDVGDGASLLAQGSCALITVRGHIGAQARVLAQGSSAQVRYGSVASTARINAQGSGSKVMQAKVMQAKWPD
jgi:hypothetical protein